MRFNHAKLNEIARESWGLRLTVELRRQRPSRCTPYGRHCMWRYHDDGRVVHDIVLANRTERTMLETLAHELEHAAQTERIGPAAFDIAYAADEDGLEAAAERAEIRWRELLPCVNRTRGAT